MGRILLQFKLQDLVDLCVHGRPVRVRAASVAPKEGVGGIPELMDLRAVQAGAEVNFWNGMLTVAAVVDDDLGDMMVSVAFDRVYARMLPEPTMPPAAPAVAPFVTAAPEVPKVNFEPPAAQVRVRPSKRTRPKARRRR